MANNQQARGNQLIHQQQATARRRTRAIWTAVVAITAVVVAGVIGYGVYASQRPTQFATPAGATADRTGLATGNGPVTVDLYVDMMCPVCRQFEQLAAPTLDRYVAANRITLVYHPLNILDGYSTTRYSTRAASAVGCSADGDKLTAYTQALFAQQPPEGGPGLTNAKLIDIGRSVGLTTPEFASCVDDGKYADWTRHVTERADAADIRSTPTVAVNGKPLPLPTQAEGLQGMVTRMSHAISNP